MGFDYCFEYSGDEVYCAYTIPYTYTQLQSHIRQIKDVSEHSPLQFIKFGSIGKSNAGIDIPFMKITNVDKKNKV